MEYHKIKFLDNASNQPNKFRAENWVEINDGSHRVYNIGNQVKLKILMIRSSLCDYSDSYIVIKGTTAVPNTGTAEAPNKRTKKWCLKIFLDLLIT